MHLATLMPHVGHTNATPIPHVARSGATCGATSGATCWPHVGHTNTTCGPHQYHMWPTSISTGGPHQCHTNTTCGPHLGHMWYWCGIGEPHVGHMWAVVAEIGRATCGPLVVATSKYHIIVHAAHMRPTCSMLAGYCARS